MRKGHDVQGERSHGDEDKLGPKLAIYSTVTSALDDLTLDTQSESLSPPWRVAFVDYADLSSERLSFVHSPGNGVRLLTIDSLHAKDSASFGRPMLRAPPLSGAAEHAVQSITLQPDTTFTDVTGHLTIRFPSSLFVVQNTKNSPAGSGYLFVLSTKPKTVPGLKVVSTRFSFPLADLIEWIKKQVVGTDPAIVFTAQLDTQDPHVKVGVCFRGTFQP